jgi:hypothetical protein
MVGRYLRLDRGRRHWGLWECARSVRSTLLDNGLYDGEMEKTQELDLTWRRVCLSSWRGGAVSSLTQASLLMFYCACLLYTMPCCYLLELLIYTTKDPDSVASISQ